MSENSAKNIALKKSQEHKENENLEKSDCCCKLETWNITQEKRTYKLNIVENKIDQIPTEEKNKQKFYNLYITTPPAKDGKATKKTITVEHKFLEQKSKCKLGIEVKDEYNNKVFLSDKNSFTIDTDGYLETVVLQKSKEALAVKKTPVLKTSNKFLLNDCISGIPNPSNNSDKHLFLSNMPFKNHPAYKEYSEIEKEELLEYVNSLSNKKPKEKGLKYFFNLFTNPKSVFNKLTLTPIGSTKCLRTRKVNIYLLEDLLLKGTASVSFSPRYAKGHKNFKGDARNEKLEVVSRYIEVSGNLELKHGTSILTYGKTVSKGEDRSKIKRKKIQDLFTGPNKYINEFYALFESATKNNKTVSINPGRTTISFIAEDMKMEEKKSAYDLDWSGKITLEIALFDKSELKVDIINAVIAKGNNKIASFVDMVRKKVKKGYDGKYFAASGEVYVDFLLKGKLSGSCTWEKKVEREIDTSGKIAGTIDISLEGKIEAKARVFEVRSKAGVKVDVKSGINASLVAKKGDSGDFEYDGDVGFNGLVIVYGYYAELERGKDKETTDEINESSRDDDEEKKIKDETKVEDELILIDKFSISDAIFGKEK